MNVEVYQGRINKIYGTTLNIPVVYYPTLVSVTLGRRVKDAAMDGQMIRATKLEALANK